MEDLQNNGVMMDEDVEVNGRPHGSAPGFDDGDISGTPNSSQGASVARMSVEKDALYYNMNHQAPGIAIIFNHEHFDIRGLKSRTGTNVDSHNLASVLKILGFKVSILHNKTSSEILTKIQEITRMDHTNFDCLLIAVLTHGEPNKLYAKDTHYNPDKLWSQFTADKCPTLAGKPKVFFIQACQDEKMYETERDGLPASYKIPVCADFLIVYSTIPGYYSWQDTTSGSWFIEALCYELRHAGKEKDIITLLTPVFRRVELAHLKYNNQKEVPTITSRLTRFLVFYSK